MGRWQEIGYTPNLREPGALEKRYILEVANRVASLMDCGDTESTFVSEWTPDKEYPMAISIAMNYDIEDEDLGFDLVFGVSDKDELVMFVRKDKWAEDAFEHQHWERRI